MTEAKNNTTVNPDERLKARKVVKHVESKTPDGERFDVNNPSHWAAVDDGVTPEEP